MSLTLIQGDITKLKVDAVVNAANSRLAPGGGVCGAIFSAAGYESLDRACRAIGSCETGNAVITPGFGLPAEYVIHAVGPVWQGGGHNEAQLLSGCYTSALNLAREKGCKSIAFPLISSGIYGYPKEDAIRIAISAIQVFLKSSELEVYLVLFDHATTELAEYILRDGG